MLATSRVSDGSTPSSSPASSSLSTTVCLRTSGLLDVDGVILVASFGTFSVGYSSSRSLTLMRIFEVPTAHSTIPVQWNILSSDVMQPLFEESFVGQWKEMKRQVVFPV